MKCGESDERNVLYRESYTPEKFFHLLIPQPAPAIIDVGAHFGESVTYLSSIFPDARIFSIEPDPESFAKLMNKLRGALVPSMCCFTTSMRKRARAAEFSSRIETSNKALLT